MAVSITTAASLVNQQLNANTSYSSTVTNPRWYTGGIADALLSVDGTLVSILSANPNHGRRVAFITSSSGVTSLSLLPTHIGPIESVQFAITGGVFNGQSIRADEIPPESVAVIDQDNQNPNSRNLFPRYALVGNTLTHNATGMAKASGVTSIIVSVFYANYVRSSALQVPDEFYTDDIAGALAILFPAEGENVQAADLYQKIWQQLLIAVSTNMPSIPQLRLQAQLAMLQAGQQ